MRVDERRPGVFIIEESDEEREDRVEALDALAVDRFAVTEGQKRVLSAVKRANRRAAVATPKDEG